MPSLSPSDLPTTKTLVKQTYTSQKPPQKMEKSAWNG